jgi:cobyrinic acid a,c-diamide synthase
MTTTTKSDAFIIAGTHSGVGKTTVTLVLLRALAARGLRVQAFKIGPDFIDTAYHTQISGRPSINLDLWMMGDERVQRSFERFSEDADVSVIEGMGALYDGEDGTERGSAAAMAKLLGVPVVLVVDVWGMTRSTAALLEGYLGFDREVCFAGFIMNRAGSVKHAQMIREALPPHLRELSLGYVRHRDGLTIQERHLGLLTVEENETDQPRRNALLDAAAEGLHLDRIAPLPRPHPATARPKTPDGRSRVRIAIARDPAFCFYYAENLELLEEAGADLCSFSPVAGETLPADVGGVYFGGGYPESFAEQLAKNRALSTQLKEQAGEGMPIYAECGGFMYLGRTLTNFDGDVQPMAGLLGFDTLMDREHLAIRYVAVRTEAVTPLGPAGTEGRGQEFHQSRVTAQDASSPLYRVTSDAEGKPAGMHWQGIAGSYVHLHFASNPCIPRNFVESCRAWRQRRKRQ